MGVLLAHPDCGDVPCRAAWCSAAPTRWCGDYPPEHCLNAIGADPLARARHVMARYTSSPAFWGVYRRAAVDTGCRRSARAPGGITWCWRSWRWPARSATWRGRCTGGATAANRWPQLARAATEQARAGLPLDDTLAEQRWRTPLITTAYAHLEMAAGDPPAARRAAAR